jgi:tetratricopeptide (TPR) repeat protein
MQRKFDVANVKLYTFVRLTYVFHRYLRGIMNGLRPIFLLVMFLTGLAAMYAQPGGGPVEQEQSTEEQLASQFYGNSEWLKAADLYEKLYEAKPVNFYYSQLLNCYLQLKDFKQADKLASRQLRRNPGNASYIVDQIWISEQAGDDSKARKAYDKLLKQFETQEDDRVKSLALALEARGKIDLAISAYLNARKSTARLYSFSMELARLYGKKGEVEKVLDEYLTLLTTQTFDYMQAIQDNIQDMLAIDADGVIAEQIRVKLLQEIQKRPDNLAISEVFIWYLVQRKDFEAALLQVKAIDKRNRENGVRVLELSRLAASNDQFETARKGYLYVIEKGKNGENYFFARKEYSLALFKRLMKTVEPTPEMLDETERELKSTYEELGVNENSAQVAIRLAHVLAFFRNKSNEALVLLETYIASSAALEQRSLNEVKLEIAEIQLLVGEIWEATLLYSQVEKAMRNDTLGQEAKFRNARLAYYKGDFEWSKAQLDVLKAATSKLIANDALELSMLIGDNLNFDTTGEALRMFSRADLAAFQHNPKGALATLDSLEIVFPESTLNDDLLYKRAQLFLQQNEVSKACEQLEKLLLSYREEILADNALMLLAGIYDYRLQQKDKAMELYKELITTFPGSLYVVEARNRFRTLRGDSVN